MSYILRRERIDEQRQINRTLPLTWVFEEQEYGTMYSLTINWLKQYLQYFKPIRYTLMNIIHVAGAVVITTAQLQSTKPELRFCASNPESSVSKVWDRRDSRQIRLYTIRRLTIPQKQFNIIYQKIYFSQEVVSYCIFLC